MLDYRLVLTFYHGKWIRIQSWPVQRPAPQGKIWRLAFVTQVHQCKAWMLKSPGIFVEALISTVQHQNIWHLLILRCCCTRRMVVARNMDTSSPKAIVSYMACLAHVRIETRPVLHSRDTIITSYSSHIILDSRRLWSWLAVVEINMYQPYLAI